MPRNDQLIRQWLLVAKLESTTGLSLAELANSLPDDYPKNPRTVRRDLDALEASGVPLVTVQRNGRTIWRLMDGRLKMILRVADTSELVGWILSFGSQVKVVRPERLRDKVREEAGRICRA